jgi:hypothetical protein
MVEQCTMDAEGGKEVREAAAAMSDQTDGITPTFTERKGEL